MFRARRRLEKREKARKEVANLERNGSGSSHGGSFDTVTDKSGANEYGAGNSESRTNYHSDTSGRKLPRGIVEVITLIGSDDDSEEEEVRISSHELIRKH